MDTTICSLVMWKMEVSFFNIIYFYIVSSLFPFIYLFFFFFLTMIALGVARATVASGGVPGSWWKYYNGAWNEPGILFLLSIYI